MAVEFRLLGDIEICADERVMSVGHARRRYVLGVLLADANRVVAADQLVARVWGEHRLPANPAGALQTYISLLRRTTGVAGNVTIARQAPGYKAIVSPDAIDLHRFRDLMGRARAASDDDGAAAALTEALGLWRGESFAGLDTPWVNSIRATLAMQRRAGFLDLTDIRLRRGQHAALLTELTAQASDHPLDERVVGQLMLALYRSGRQADALAHYQHIRQRLAEDLGTDPGPPLRELFQRILTAEETPDAPAGPTAAISARSVTPRQLPAPPREFTGRAGELDRLTALLDREAGLRGGTPPDGQGEPARPVMISAIGGAGGMGKTWLALHWAHRHLDRFPDGQLWVDLRGFDPAGAPMTAATALRGFLDALGVDPAALPPGQEAQAGLYRSLMAGKRMLVVLDNARDSGQVTPLLPGGSGCAVLITSRRRLTGLVTGHGAHTLDLDVLPEDQARELLARYLGPEPLAAEPDATAELLACCAGLPLAISVVAARATTHPDFPLAALAAELRETATRLDALETSDLSASVRAVLSWSYRAQEPRAAAVFGQLGLAPGPDIGLTAAAALTMLPPGQARSVLRELESASLLQEQAPGRYRMHDLVRLYAAEQGDRNQPAATRTAALRRMTDFYLHRASAASRLLAPRAQATDPGQRPLDRPPHQQSRACQPADAQAADAHRPADENQSAHAQPAFENQAADAHRPAEENQSAHAQPAFENQPADEYQPADETAAMAWFAAEHACLLASQRLALARGWHEQAWRLAMALNTFHRRSGHFGDWVETWRVGLEAAEHLNRPAAEGAARGFLGFACAHAGRQAEALDHLNRALSLAERTGDLNRQAHVHIFLCATWSLGEDHRQALSHATSARALFHALGDRVWEADALSSEGTCQARLGQLGEARACCEAALALHQEHRFGEAEARTLHSLGYIAHQAGHHTLAVDYYARALALQRDLGNAYRQPEALAGLAAAHAARGDQDEARRAWRQARDLFLSQHRAPEAADLQSQLDALS